MVVIVTLLAFSSVDCSVDLYSTATTFAGDALTAKQHYNGPYLLVMPSATELAHYDLIIDGLLGTA